MRSVEAKNDLSRARQAQRRLGALAERRRRYGELAEVRTPGSAPALDDLQRELDARIQEYALLVGDIERRIDALDRQQYRDLLRYRYLNGWSWQRVAGEMELSRDWLMRLHARALEEILEKGQ